MEIILIDTRIASLVGNHAERAFLLEKICYWSNRNKLNGKNNIDGKFWVYNTGDAWADSIRYKSTSTVLSILRWLVKEEWIFTANHNKNKFDRTAWFAPNWEKIDREMSFLHLKICNTRLSKSGNGETEIDNGETEFDNGKTDSVIVTNINNNRSNNINTNINIIGDDENIAQLSNDEIIKTTKSKVIDLDEPNFDVNKTIEAPTTNTKPFKSKINTNTHWDVSDPLAGIYSNLTKLSICKAKFNTDDYKIFITALMEKFSLTIKNLEELSNEWQEYHNEKSTKPKVTKSSFRTWVKNYVDRRNGQSFNRPGTASYSKGSTESSRHAGANNYKPELSEEEKRRIFEPTMSAAELFGED